MGLKPTGLLLKVRHGLCSFISFLILYVSLRGKLAHTGSNLLWKLIILHIASFILWMLHSEAVGFYIRLHNKISWPYTWSVKMLWLLHRLCLGSCPRLSLADIDSAEERQKSSSGLICIFKQTRLISELSRCCKADFVTFSQRQACCFSPVSSIVSTLRWPALTRDITRTSGCSQCWESSQAHFPPTHF